MERREFIWVEKYRPKKVKDCVLTARVKKVANGIIKSGKIPNITFAGSAGIGKTTVARALCNELDYDFLYVNASLDRGIDVVKTTLTDYSSKVSMEGKRKCVILDEADNMAIHTQPALRGFVEGFSRNCTFVLTCNSPNKIMSAIRSRCPVLDFNFRESDFKTIAAGYIKRMVAILKAEKIEFDSQVLVPFMKQHYPDFRKMVGKLQEYSNDSQEIDSGILNMGQEYDITALIHIMQGNKYTDLRGWIADNVNYDPDRLFHELYTQMSNHLADDSLPAFGLILAEWQRDSYLAADKELHLLGCLTEVMHEGLKFK
jgi:replication-associated recombination protein RarA